MIENRIEQVILLKQAALGRRITDVEISETTGIARSTLSRLRSDDGKGIRFDVLDGLCKFFDCQVGDILVYVPDE